MEKKKWYAIEETKKKTMNKKLKLKRKAEKNGKQLQPQQPEQKINVE